MERETNFYGELFWIAGYLEDGDEVEWSRMAFDRALDLFWKQGSDPRLVSNILPKLVMGYLPFDLRTDIPASRRAELNDRLYRMAPYVQGSSAACSALAAYFFEVGEPQQAALWRARAAESERQSGYIWEFSFFALRALRLVPALLLAIVVFCVVLQRRYAPQRRLLRQPGFVNWLRRRDPRWSLGFWRRGDRLALALLLLFLWLDLGVFGAIGELAVQTDSIAITVGLGSLRPPVARAFLEALDKTPARDFLLALSLQQQGEPVGAETLYRTMPNSATAWNNLGVIEAEQGRMEESGESFRKALEIDPEMSEAAFNLGLRTKGYLAGVHQQDLPRGKMLAMPSHDVMLRAMRGSAPQLAGRILMGPFSALKAVRAIGNAYYDFYSTDGPLPLRLALGLHNLWTWGLSIVLGSLMVLLYSAPYREAPRASSRWHWLIDLIVPGVSPRWTVWGGIVLGLFVYGILETVFHRSYWTWFNWAWELRGLSLGLSPALEPAFQNAWPPVASSLLWAQGPAVLGGLLLAVNAVICSSRPFRW